MKIADTLPIAHPPRTIENLFSLEVSQKLRTTKICMQMLNNTVNTSQMPFVVPLLRKHIPGVLRTQCFNDEKLPFRVEVRNTEMGHLFEHVLLEYLCQLKIAKGFASATYSGRTSWNWVRDPRGKFHISLTCGAKDTDILTIALEKTITVMKLILQADQAILFPTKRAIRNGLKNGRKAN